MSDDDVTPKEKPPRSRRTSISNVVQKWRDVASVWKTLLLIGAMIGAGFAGREFLDSRYARAGIADTLVKFAEDRGKIRSQVSTLAEVVAANTARVTAVEVETAKLREDIRTLTAGLMRNPP